MTDRRLNQRTSRKRDSYSAKSQHIFVNVEALLLILIVVTGLLSLFLIGLYLLRGEVTGLILVEKKLNFSDTLGLEFKESSEYTWIPENKGLLESLKISGSYKTGGDVKVYLDDDGKRYLIFDSNRLNESKIHGITGAVTGFAILNESENQTVNNETAENNASTTNKTDQSINENNITIDNETIEINQSGIINETTPEINETQINKTPEKEKEKPEKPAKPEPNVPPVWKSDVEEFVINGKTIIDLNEYFEDKNNDTISYEATAPENMDIKLADNLLTITPAENNFNTTITFIASDGNKTTSKEVILIVPERRIIIGLEYKSGSIYDVDDDGIEDINSVIDLTVENTKFNWDVDESKLCTRWNIFNVDEVKSATVCYGSQSCCAFVDLVPERQEWNETLFLAYGLYETSYSNNASAQVLHIDFNLSFEEPYSEIYYSSWKDLPVKFSKEFASFENICIETCKLSIDKRSYNLIIEVSNSTLKLDKINYAIKREEENKAPVLANNISNLKLTEESLTINLSNYFEDADGDLLLFDYYKAENVQVQIENNVATIIPEESFEGFVYLFFTANDSYQSTISNVFSINITQVNITPITAIPINITPKNITLPENITQINKTGVAFIKNIPNISMAINSVATINLSHYFLNIDNALFTYLEKEGISIIFTNNIAAIIPSKDFTGIVYTFITANKDFETAISNVFSIRVSELGLNITNETVFKKDDIIEEKTPKPEVVVGKPVKWVKRVKLSDKRVNATINITPDATNISVKKIENNITDEIPEGNIKIREDGEVKKLKIYEIEKEIERLEKEIREEDNLDEIRELEYKIDILKAEKDSVTGAVTLITGNAVKEENENVILKAINKITNSLLSITGFVPAEPNTINLPEAANKTEVIIEELVQEVEVEYYTQGPKAEEIEIDERKKQIVISSDVHYENILAFTTLPTEAIAGAVKLFWLVNDSKIEVNIDKFDTNGNNLVDYIEWIVPSLSNQTYELSITILNVQSFPTLFGNWTVRFNTTGIGNLTISASNGTTNSELYIDNESTKNDLTTIELKCDNNILFNYYDNVNNDNSTNDVYLIKENNEKIRLNETLNKNEIIKSIYVENYNCTGTGYWTVKVITTGKHTQQFNFSGLIAYAKNVVSTINNNFTIPRFPQKDENVTFFINITDSDNDINSVNFTVIDPSGTKVKAGVNGSRNTTVPTTTELWNVTHNLTSYGTWLWNISVFDAEGNIVNSSTGTIILMELTESLNATSVSPNSSIAVFGHINLSNGTNVSNTVIRIFRNETELTGKRNRTEGTDDDWNLSTNNVNVTINPANITLKVNDSNQYPNQTGNFSSAIFDTNVSTTQFDFISWTTEVPYQTEIGMALEDKNDAATKDGFINTSGLALLMHFNNNSGLGENNSLFFDSSEADGLNNGTCVLSANKCPSVNLTNKKFGKASMSFDGKDDVINTTKRGFSNSSGTIQAWINPRANADGINYTIISTPTEISNQSSLKGWWHLNGESTSFTDFSGNGKTGTAEGALDCTGDEGRFGNGCLFDGVDDRIDTGTNFLQATTSFTVSAWFKTSSATNQLIAGKYTTGAHLQLDFRMQSSGKILGRLGNTVGGNYLGPESRVVNDGNWHHAVIVHDASVPRVDLYVDGILDVSDSNPVGTVALNQAHVFTIGFFESGDFPFNGQIDEVAVWDRTLSSAEIRDIYLGGLSLHKFGDNITFHVGNVTLRAPSSNLAANSWSHVAGTYAGSNAELYIDGNLLSSTTTFSPTTFFSLANNNTFIGNDEYNGTDFDGLIDELAVFNRSLSAQEILNLYKRGVLRLNLSVRSCDDSACSGESFSEPLTNVSAIRLNTSITPINRYFQYKTVLNTENVNYTPALYNATVNYTILSTNAKGDYNFTFTAPSGFGNYPIKVNTTFDGITGSNSINLIVGDLPTVNTALNKSFTNIGQNDIINLTANVTDDTGLSFCQIIINQSGPTALEFINISLSGTSAQCSNSSQVTLAAGNVINYTIRVNDTTNNFRTNDTIITVAERNAPIVNTTLNKSFTNISQNDIINITANVTDDTGLSFCQIIINQSGPTALQIINISLSGTSAQCSNSSQVTLSGGNVINYTIRVNDTFNNFKTNDTIITVKDDINPIVNTTLNKSFTEILQNDIINITANVTDNIELSFCQIIINQSGPTAIEIINISLSGTTAQCSNSSQVTLSVGNVINYTIRVNDTSNNFRTNDTIITVVERNVPVINTSLNKSLTNITVNDIINITANVTDDTGLNTGQIFVNISGFVRIFNFSLSGTTATFSQNITINVTRGEVINFTARANDTFNNFRTNDTIITVANTQPSGFSIVFPANDQKFSSVPVGMNVTFANDPDGDTTTINYYINGKLNGSTTTNTTFNASDGTYILNASITDSIAHHDNITINFTVDATAPSTLVLNVGPTIAEFAVDNVSVNFSASDTRLDTTKVNVSFPNSSLLAEYTANFTLNTTNLTVIGNYTVTLFANDSAGNFQTTSKQLKVQDTTPPSAFNLLSPADGTRSNDLTPSLDWQNTTEANFKNYTIEFSSTNTFAFINNTFLVNNTVNHSNITLTTSLTANLNWTWRVIAYDKENQSRTSTSAFRYETFQNSAPTQPNNTLPSNNSIVIYDNVIFAWNKSTDADGDNVTYDLLIAKDTAFTDIDLNRTGINSSSLDLKKNESTLSDGRRYWKARAYDNTNYSDYSNYTEIRSIVAALNITAPANNTKVYSGNRTQIDVREVNGTAWIINVTVEINNTNYTASNTDNDWSVNVTFSSLTAQELNITAYGYNETDNATTTTYRTIIFSKVSAAPKIDYVCSNETYALNNTNVTINLKSILATLINTTNVTITNPSNVVIELNLTSSTKEDLIYKHNFLHLLNETGNYTLNATVTDIEGKGINKSSVFYVVTAVKTINITGINLTNIKFNDVCTGSTTANGTSIITTIPDDALYDVEIVTAKPKVVFNNLNLTNTTSLLNYTDLAKNISAPSGQRIATEFEIKTNLTKFDNITVSYNYTSIEDSLDDETGLRMYKCDSQASCTFTLLTTTLNTTTNIISTVVNNLSVFLVSETAATTTTKTVTETKTISEGGGGGGGGGGSIVTKVASLDIIVPSPIALHTKDSITVPLIIRNRGEIKLNEISLGSEIKVSGITVGFTNNYFGSLGIDEIATTQVTITTNLEEFTKNEVTITVSVTDPELKESVDIIIDTIDIYKGNVTRVEEKLKFTADIFEQNPDCLELKELLAEAEKALENKEFQKAIVLTESAINACRQLVGTKFVGHVVAKPSRVGFRITLPLAIMALIIILALIAYAARKGNWKIPRWRRPGLRRPRLRKPSFNLRFRFLKRMHMPRTGPTKKEVREFEDEERRIRRMMERKGL